MAVGLEGNLLAIEGTGTEGDSLAAVLGHDPGWLRVEGAAQPSHRAVRLCGTPVRGLCWLSRGDFSHWGFDDCPASVVPPPVAVLGAQGRA